MITSPHQSDRETFEVTQDPDGGVRVTPVDATSGCHSGGTMEDAARKAGKSEILDQYAADYPVGPHDKPQSMCPAFGSPLVTATSGAASLEPLR